VAQSRWIDRIAVLARSLSDLVREMLRPPEATIRSHARSTIPSRWKTLDFLGSCELLTRGNPLSVSAAARAKNAKPDEKGDRRGGLSMTWGSLAGLQARMPKTALQGEHGRFSSQADRY